MSVTLTAGGTDGNNVMFAIGKDTKDMSIELDKFLENGLNVMKKYYDIWQNSKVLREMLTEKHDL